MIPARSIVVAFLTLTLAGTARAQGSMAAEPMLDRKDKKEMKDAVTFTVILKGRWTAANFPLEYPTGAHFSGLIGASHRAGYALFSEGRTPSTGLERLSEMGRHSPLDDEIRAAIARGDASALVTSGPLKDFADSVVTTVTVDAAHPFVSVVAMIAPSPDWFAGAANIDLRDMGDWSARRTVELMAYDSGGDDGTTFAAADKDTSPKRPTTPASARHFAPKGTPMPVATLTLVRR